MKVLIVDDSFAVRIMVKKYLEEKGYTVFEAVDGLNALEVLKDIDEVQMILTDLNMPIFNGLEFIERARELSEFKTTPVLIYTTEVIDSFKKKAQDLGVRAWLKKPLALEKIADVIKRVSLERTTS